MTSRDAAIVWPAPGFPAFVEPHDPRLDVIIAARRPDMDALRAGLHQATLAEPDGRPCIPLMLEDLAPADSGAITRFAGGYAALPHARNLSFFQARLRIPSLPRSSAGRTFELFGLSVDGLEERPRSVAILARPGNILNLAFAGDLHVAALWDEVAAAVERHAPELAESMIHPHSLVDRFISEANALAARGELDLIVLGGDLVDHVRTRRRDDGNEDGGATNISRLLAMLARLEVPTLIIPGNHDHRCFPRRLRSSGLECVGIPRAKGAHLLRKAGLWDLWPVSPGDVDALRIADGNGVPGLADYLTCVAPVTDYCCSIHGLRLLFASTGCDILVKWREVERTRWGLLLRELRTARYHPDSEGFTEAQLQWIRGRLQQGGGTALFFHAPLLSAPADGRNGTDVEQLHLGSRDSLTAGVEFERRMHRAGLRCGVGFRNPGVLIRDLAEARVPAVTFSGHLHRASSMEIDRRTMLLRPIGLDRAGAGSDAIRLLTAPALGQIQADRREPPGYLLARFVDGELVSLNRCTLMPGR